MGRRTGGVRMEEVAGGGRLPPLRTDRGLRRIRQITHGLGLPTMSPLPSNDDIVFASTRCVQTVDCWWTEVSNLYTCDAAGRYLRRLGFDQVHTIYPKYWTTDGDLHRWDYNDRTKCGRRHYFK